VLVPDIALPYRLNAANQLVREPLPDLGDGAGAGVISTVHDLGLYDVAMDENLILSAKTTEAMFSPTIAPDVSVLPYGYGWYVETYKNTKLLWHSGWQENAYSALYLKVPSQNLTLIVLANSEGVWWNNPLDKAAVEQSPLAAAFLTLFAGVS
jgi:hypothetical protein